MPAEMPAALIPPQSLPDLELHLGFLIHDISRLRRAAFDRYVKHLRVTRSQCWVLAELSREDGMTQTELAARLDLGKVAIGGLIDRLEKSGLVRRTAAPNDRRVHLIFLAPKSKRVLAAIRKATDEFNARVSAGLDAEELLVADQVLEKMKRNLRDVLLAGEAERRGNGAFAVNFFSGAGSEQPIRQAAAASIAADQVSRLKKATGR